MQPFLVLLFLFLIAVRGKTGNLRQRKDSQRVRVFLFNIEYGAEAYDLQSIVDQISETNSDVVIINEHLRSNGSDASIDIASRLQWYHTAAPYAAGAVISRWPVQTDSAFSEAHANYKHEDWIKLGGWLSLVKVGGDQNAEESAFRGPPRFYIFVIHLNDVPYQPYQAMGFAYDPCTTSNTALSVNINNIDCHHKISDANDLVNSAWHARGNVINLVLEQSKALAKRKENFIIAGDFNEPSDLDWTSRAVKAGLVPLRAKFKVSKWLRSAGMRDAYRAVHRDEVAEPGYTWYDPTTSDPTKGRADRIDFIYVQDVSSVKVRSCDVRSRGHTLSDHLPVQALVEFDATS